MIYILVSGTRRANWAHRTVISNAIKKVLGRGGVTPQQVRVVLDRLLGVGAVYRARRRTRVLLKAGPRPGPRSAAPDGQPGLWEVDGG